MVRLEALRSGVKAGSEEGRAVVKEAVDWPSVMKRQKVKLTHEIGVDRSVRKFVLYELV